MLIIPPPKFPQRRIKPRKFVPPVALTLVAAAFNADDLYVTLTFDRAIDIAAIDPSVIRVYDGGAALAVYQGAGDGASLDGPATLRLEMEEFGESAAGPVLLVSSDQSGIVAENDGGTWAGAVNVVLPFSA